MTWLKLPTVRSVYPSNSSVGFREMNWIAPPVALRPNSVPCGPRSVSTRARSNTGKLARLIELE